MECCHYRHVGHRSRPYGPTRSQEIMRKLPDRECTPASWQPPPGCEFSR